MENTLKHSVYLSDAEDDLYHRQQILREDGSGSINDSATKRPFNYHRFEKTMVATFEFDDQTNQQTYRKSSQQQHQEAHYRNRHRIDRPCHNSYRALLNDHRLMMRPREAKEEVERRQRLCRHREQRKAERIDDFKSNLLRRIRFEGSDEVESSIQEQIVQGLQARLQRVSGFLKRQQFYEQERQILREMRQFCRYGAIKIS